MTQIKLTRRPRICQGDIFRDVEYIEYAIQKKGNIELSKILFPIVVVLTQDCDLEQDHRFRKFQDCTDKTQDKLLMSVLVAPLYNAEQVFLGEHLSELGLEMEKIEVKKSPGKYLKQNERPRYHYLSFPKSPNLVDSVVDFKHYFSVNVNYLSQSRKNQFVCRLGELHRELLSQRFANYLSRIGLPEPSVTQAS